MIHLLAAQRCCEKIIRTHSSHDVLELVITKQRQKQRDVRRLDHLDFHKIAVKWKERESKERRAARPRVRAAHRATLHKITMGRSSSSSSGSDDESHKRKKRKREKSSSSHKHEKKHKHHKKDKKHHRKEESARPRTDVCYEPISEADYFLKATEFQQWLQQERRTFLDEITSDEARRLFKKFASKWNAGELPTRFYTGEVGGGAQPAASRTRHEWGFVSKLSDADQLQLDRAADSARAQTNLSSSKGAGSQGGPTNAAVKPRGPIGPVAGPMAGPAAGPAAGPSSTSVRGGGGNGGGGAGPSAAAPPGSRLAELQAKEQERMANFRKQMGL